MDINGSLDKMKFDKRLVEKNIQKGLITQQEYDNYLSSLADEGHSVEALSLEESVDQESITDTEIN